MWEVHQTTFTGLPTGGTGIETGAWGGGGVHRAPVWSSPTPLHGRGVRNTDKGLDKDKDRGSDKDKDKDKGSDRHGSASVRDREKGRHTVSKGDSGGQKLSSWR